MINSNIRKNFKKKSKIPKNIYPNLIKLIEKKIGFELTTDQIKALDQINLDISSKERMFRLLQGDVGSGKTIVSLIAAINVILNSYQVAFMAPTEILAKQHYNLFLKLFKITSCF